MPRGKLVSKSEAKRAVPTLRANKAVPAKAKVKAAKKESIAKVSRTAKPVEKTPAITRSHQPGISITVQIPALRRTKNVTNTSDIPHKHKRKFITLAATAIVIVAGSIFFLPTFKHAPKPQVVEAAKRTAPDYQPLIVADTASTSKSYDGQRNMVSYTTNFSNTRVTVSEQNLPANFSSDPAALQRTADSIHATQKIDTSSGPVFVANNETAGDQMGIFADAHVLIFIHAEGKMDDVSWKSFVEQLKPTTWQEFNTKTE